MARPSKGDRLSLTTKLLPPYGDKLERYCAATGETKQDFSERAIMRALDDVDLEAIEGQERLPMTA